LKKSTKTDAEIFGFGTLIGGDGEVRLHTGLKPVCFSNHLSRPSITILHYHPFFQTNVKRKKRPPITGSLY